MTNGLISKLLLSATLPVFVVVFTLGQKKPTTFRGETILASGASRFHMLRARQFLSVRMSESLGIGKKNDIINLSTFSGLRAMPVPFNTACPAYSPSTAASSSPAHNIEVPLRENRIGGGGGGGRGMTRSSASYGIQQLLQEQVRVTCEKRKFDG